MKLSFSPDNRYTVLLLIAMVVSGSVSCENDDEIETTGGDFDLVCLAMHIAARSEDLKWPDSFVVSPDGTIYFTISQYN